MEQTEEVHQKVPQDTTNYHKEYYRRNAEAIRAKRRLRYQNQKLAHEKPTSKKEEEWVERVLRPYREVLQEIKDKEEQKEIAQKYVQ